MGTPSTMTNWKRFQARRSRNGLLVKLSPEETFEIIEREGTRFHGFVLNAAGMSSSGKKQRFYLTFVAVFHGLSKMGVNILSAFNMTMPSSSYYRMRKDELRRAKEQVRSSISFKIYLFYETVCVAGKSKRALTSSGTTTTTRCTTSNWFRCRGMFSSFATGRAGRSGPI